jgi:hypothetical protein
MKALCTSLLAVLMAALPDSSQVIMASNSGVQMTSFNMTDIAHARFVVAGKVRFKVNHPQGAKADYHDPIARAAACRCNAVCFPAPASIAAPLTA